MFSSEIIIYSAILLLRYGTRNQAFDPDIENDPDVLRAMDGNNIFTGGLL